MKVAIRGKGGLDYGWGHLVRARRLAQAWSALRSDAEIILVAEGADAERIRAPWQGDWLRLPEPGTVAGEREWLDRVRPEVLVIDQLDVPAELLSVYLSAGCYVAVFDDLGCGYASADCVISPQPLEHGSAAGPGQLLLEGLSYFVLDPGFLASSDRDDSGPEAQRLLVVLGGGLPEGVQHELERLLDVLAGTAFEVSVALGFQQSGSLERPAAENIGLVRDTNELPQLMRSAQIALASGGYVKMELAAAGVPSALVSIVDHQMPLARHFAERTGAATYLGDFQELGATAIVDALLELAADADRRAKMSAAGRASIDGLGAERIVSHIEAAVQQRQHAGAHEAGAR